MDCVANAKQRVISKKSLVAEIKYFSKEIYHKDYTLTYRVNGASLCEPPVLFPLSLSSCECLAFMYMITIIVIYM
jgi:hypothetical protein